MGIIWSYNTHKRMPWTIRLIAFENITHFTLHVRKKSLRSTQNKQAKKINKKDKTYPVLNKENVDYVTTNSWKPLFVKMGNH